ncbi:MAG: DUF2000 domain-containing protein [Spirochaetaceae bacterium]|nr:DUF2000 domain-containing protein [Spirochaetaceae bacterium]
MRIAIVLDEGLPPGLAANASAALALSLTSRIGDVIGPAVVDADGSPHAGILTVPIPVLRCPASELGGLREKALRTGGVGTLDFSSLAQAARDYGDYSARLAAAGAAAIVYRGLCFYGEDAAVRGLTGSLPLYR